MAALVLYLLNGSIALILYLLNAHGSSIWVQGAGTLTLDQLAPALILTDLPHEASPQSALARPLAHLEQLHGLLHRHPLCGSMTHLKGGRQAAKVILNTDSEQEMC